MTTITLALELPLSDHDRAVLSALATAGLGDLPPAPVKKAPAEAPVKKAPVKKAPAPEPAPAEPETEATEAPAEATEAPAEAPAKGTDGPTVDDAVARAAALLSEGRADAVKAALASLDINRVSQLKPSQVGAFLEALDA